MTDYDKVDQLYPPERLTHYEDAELPTLVKIAEFDRDNENTIYGGRTREATIQTAERSIADITAEIERRKVEAARVRYRELVDLFPTNRSEALYRAETELPSGLFGEFVDFASQYDQS
ncbi:hypothetical protein [Amycolatopsis sp. NPDC003731]